MNIKIGWSNFCLNQQKKNDAKRFKGAPKDLITLVKKHWKDRKPGKGRKDLTQVVVVPIAEKHLFKSPWLDIQQAKRITGRIARRQPQEDPFLKIRGSGKTLPILKAEVVLYSKATLLENNGERSGDYDWEIVAILTGPGENPPMDPLAMARNFLQKPGGTFAPYTAQQFAEAIYFWAQYIQTR